MYIPYGRQDIQEEDIDAVIETLKSDWLTQGPMIEQFENAIANYTHSQQAVAVANATAGLHLACMALHVQRGDWVWTSPNTFVASANCALYCGAKVDFVDIDPKTYNISTNALADKLWRAKKENRLPKLVIIVHFAGQSCDMQTIKSLSDQYGFKILEDASHAIGGRYQNEPIGNCRYSDAVVFSLHPVKIITTGEGGVVTTNNAELAERIRLLRSHGITRDSHKMTAVKEGEWFYQQQELGFNYRITELQCALGLSQLKRLDDYVALRNQYFQEYNNKFIDLPLILPMIQDDCYSSCHLYVIQINPLKTNRSRTEIFNYLRSNEIGVNVHYIPVHLQPYYQKLGFKQGQFPVAEKYYQQTITLPLFPRLTTDMRHQIYQALTEALQ